MFVSHQAYIVCKFSNNNNVDKLLTSLPSYSIIYANIWIGLPSSSPNGKWKKSSITLAYSSSFMCVSSSMLLVPLFVGGESPFLSDGHGLS